MCLFHIGNYRSTEKLLQYFAKVECKDIKATRQFNLNNVFLSDVQVHRFCMTMFVAEIKYMVVHYLSPSHGFILHKREQYIV